MSRRRLRGCTTATAMNTSYRNSLWFDYEILNSSWTTEQLYTTGEKQRYYGNKSLVGVKPRAASCELIRQNIFMERCKLCGKGKQIHDRLTRLSREREQDTVVCYAEAESRASSTESLSRVRRLCFCQSIGRKFCAVCREDISKGLNHDIPGIIRELGGSRNDAKPSLRDQLQYAGNVLNSVKDKRLKKSKQQQPPSLLSLRSASTGSSASSVASKCRSSPPDTSTDIHHIPRSTVVSSSVPPSLIGSKPNTAEEQTDREGGSQIQDKDAQEENEMAKSQDDWSRSLDQNSPGSQSTSHDTHTAKDHGREHCAGDTISADNSEPWHSYPVGPELIELKYINFNVYDTS